MVWKTIATQDVAMVTLVQAC
ncbi:hypothetical protein CRUP_022077 [Coryphaenoides rupestris]|nr:hypothetical protein CRUP_022077 [Coryphaenoides rupestris]